MTEIEVRYKLKSDGWRVELWNGTNEVWFLQRGFPTFSAATAAAEAVIEDVVNDELTFTRQN